MAEYQPLHKPVRINPLIRAARYGMIFSGIIYGARRFSNLKKSTKEEQQEILRQIERRDANKKIQDKIRGDAQMIDLAKEAGIQPKV